MTEKYREYPTYMYCWNLEIYAEVNRLSWLAQVKTAEETISRSQLESDV